MKATLVLLLTFFVSACAATSPNLSKAPSQSATPPPPEKGMLYQDVKQGLSLQRLKRVNLVMDNYVAQKQLAGTLTLVARNGEVVHLEASGDKNRETQSPMTEDAIFRIYSMTKPITAVAALTLWEQGKFHMNDPIEKFLPELKDMNVYVSGKGESMVVEKAKSKIRIIDLFMHTAGFSYGFTGSEVDNMYRELFARSAQSDSQTLLKDLAKLPLNHQPGTKWHYGVNTDIIGFLVERISGQKLGDYMQNVIFNPLEMNDTAFFVDPSKASRLAQVYGPNDKGQTVPLEQVPLGDFMSDPIIHNGGGGLTSTIGDYYKFAQMLLNGGELNGKRILGRKTVEYLSTNHLPANLIPYSPNSPGEGYGLAMSVTVDEGQVTYMSSTGNYGWGGAASTYFRIDPSEKMIIIAMAQFMPNGFYGYQNDFRNLVYQALVD